MMSTLRAFAVLFIALLAAPFACAAGPRPNIVVFLVDDMGWQDTSVPFHNALTALNRRYHTPSMEVLARDGMKFTQAYATAVCTPTRVSLITGLNAARHGATNWILRRDTSPDPDHPTLTMPAWNVNGLSPVPGVPRTFHAKALPAFLSEAGYRTIHAGKAHWGAQGTPGADPRQLGFDVNIGGHCAGSPGSHLGQESYRRPSAAKDPIWDVPGLAKYHGTDTFLTEALTLEANAAMAQAVADGVPFFLHFAHYAIHAPIEADPRFVQKYRDAGLPGPEAALASMIEGMDKSLGDVRHQLRRLGIERDTLFLFLTDNGASRHGQPNLPLRGRKLTPYEGGIRVPMLAAWPGKIVPGSTCAVPVIVEDVFATVLDAAGVPCTASIDGRSFLPLLRGTQGGEDRALVWHFPHSYEETPYSALRKGDWKLIYFHAGPRYELYNLRDDLSESRDCFADEPARAKALASELGALLRERGAKMPFRKDTGEPVPLPGE